MSKLEKYLKLLEDEVKKGSIYVWGGQGQPATEELIERLETSSANIKTAKSLLKKRIKAGCKNARAFDCSGLVTKLMEEAGIAEKGFDTTAQMLRKIHTERIKRSDLRPGDMVFRKNSEKTYHVGVVVDDALNVIEARGRAYGVVKRALNASGTAYWNAYGRPTALKEEIEDRGIAIARLLKKKLILMTGADVAAVQKRLISMGYSCGSCGADGEYGAATEKAVKRFQKAQALKKDGIVGRHTAKALGFEFLA